MADDSTSQRGSVRTWVELCRGWGWLQLARVAFLLDGATYCKAVGNKEL